MAEAQQLQQWHVAEPYLETHCSLGEGPFYEPATNSVRFVDIIKQRLHTVSLTEGPASLKTLQFSEAVTVTADIEGRDPKDAVLIGAKQGLAVLDRNTGTYEYVTKFDDDKAQRIRSNDGVVDPNGRFWLGTMTDFGLGPFQPEGESESFLPDPFLCPGCLHRPLAASQVHIARTICLLPPKKSHPPHRVPRRAYTPHQAPSTASPPPPPPRAPAPA